MRRILTSTISTAVLKIFSALIGILSVFFMLSIELGTLAVEKKIFL